MSVLRDILEELFSMFAGDARLSLGVLATVAVSAALAAFVRPWVGGAALLLGCLAVLLVSVMHAARR